MRTNTLWLILVSLAVLNRLSPGTQRPQPESRNPGFGRRSIPLNFSGERAVNTTTQTPGPAWWLGVDAHLLANYGVNHERLAAVRATYDPDNFFHINQNIALANGS